MMHPTQILDVQLLGVEEESFITDMEDEKHLISMVQTPSRATTKDKQGKYPNTQQYFSIGRDTIHGDIEDITHDEGLSAEIDISQPYVRLN